LGFGAWNLGFGALQMTGTVRAAIGLFDGPLYVWQLPTAAELGQQPPAINSRFGPRPSATSVCVIEQTPAGAVCQDFGRLRKSRSAGRRRNRRHREFFRNLKVGASRAKNTGGEPVDMVLVAIK
jgi:hypothetical protein